MKKVELVVNTDRTIRADVYACEGEAKGILIVCHGFKGFKDWGMFPWIGERFSRSRHTVVFNFSGNGVGQRDFDELEKFARNTYAQELDDLDRVVTAVRAGGLLAEWIEEERRRLPVYLLGHSKGGADALLYALDHPAEVDGVVLWNGSLDPAGVFGGRLLDEMREQGRAYIENARTKQRMPLDRVIAEDLDRNRERYDVYSRIVALQVPVALVQGTEDYARLQQGSRKLIELRPDIPWLRVEGGNHTFGAVHPYQGPTPELLEAARVTEEWLDSLADGRRVVRG